MSLPVAIFPEPERYWITTDLCARVDIVECRTWKYYYYTIYQANLILRIHTVSKGDPEKLKPYIQQAYFAKAVAYFYLAMNYGQVPITGSTIEFSKFPQSPIGNVLDEAENGD